MPAVPIAALAQPHGGPDATVTGTAAAYKQDIAARISRRHSAQVYPGQPQALLRAVVVVRFVVDAQGQLVHSEIVRTNHDKTADITALTTLRTAAPFPRPATALLHHGRLELTETWLFNNDGRFQIRSVAQQQMDH